jgi:3-oxoacyl-[acyl-carrier protein] reductase
VIELNLIAVMSGIQQVLPTMREAGGGAIVTIASVGGLGYGQYALADYGAAKAGVVRLTSSLGGLAETDRVRVNCICPGLVDTPASRRSRAKLPPDRQPTVWLTPDDIGAAAMHLIGDDSLAGRVLVWHEGQPWQLVPLDQEPLGVH